MTTARAGIGSFGTKTAAIACGGDPDGNFTENWNGTSWAEVNNMNTTREAMGSAGLQTSGLIFGGSASPKQQTESWNGSIWTETNDLNIGRSDLGGAGSNTLALAFGGRYSLTTAATEEWIGDGIITETVN
jgi:hypothetical protein